ncbi:MAG: hypothetical protein ABJA67_08820 [Chthonomonadales bacterium]
MILPLLIDQKSYCGYRPVDLFLTFSDVEDILQAKQPRKITLLLDLITAIRLPPFPQMATRGRNCGWNGVGLGAYDAWSWELENNPGIKLQDIKRAKRFRASRNELVGAIANVAGSGNITYQRKLFSATNHLNNEIDLLLQIQRNKRLSDLDTRDILIEARLALQWAAECLEQALYSLVPTAQMAALTSPSQVDPTSLDVIEIVYAARTGTTHLRRLAAEKLIPVQSPEANSAMMELLFDADLTTRSIAAFRYVTTDATDSRGAFGRMLESERTEWREFANAFLTVRPLINR